MIWVTPRAIAGSGSAPPTKSGSAIGIGWMLPSVIVILGAARTRAHMPAAAAATDRPVAPASKRRRESVSSSDRMFRFLSHQASTTQQVQIRETMSAAEHFHRIEVDRKLFPDLVFRQREHRVWLARDDGPARAFDHGKRIRVGGPHLHF